MTSDLSRPHPSPSCATARAAPTVLGLVAGDRVRALDRRRARRRRPQRVPRRRRTGIASRLLADGDDDWLPLADVTLTAPVEPRQVLQTGANYRTHVIDLVAAGRTQNADPRPIEELRAWAAEMMDRRAREGMPYFFIGLPAAVVGDDVDARAARLQRPARLGARARDRDRRRRRTASTASTRWSTSPATRS